MVLTINGIPGSGKNVLAVHQYALKHYKHENFFLRRIIRRILHKPIWINNVYSTFPILLKSYPFWSKKKPVFSKRVTIYDLVPGNKFEDNASIIIDEAQAFYDSEDFREFPQDIAIFNQFHRHFGISNIIYITQHPSRLMKKLRILCSEFDKVNAFLKLPILPFGFMHIISYFEFDDYGKYHHPKKEAKTYDVKNSYKLFNAKKVFKSYDSTYLRVLNINSPIYDRGCFNSGLLSTKEIKYIYRDKI